MPTRFVKATLAAALVVAGIGTAQAEGLYALRAEYEHYHFSDAFDAKANVGELSFGLKVGF